MQENKFLTHILTDIKVKLDAEFKENFTRKAFFNEKWKNIPYIFFTCFLPTKLMKII